jgi:hypothetical protein
MFKNKRGIEEMKKHINSYIENPKISYKAADVINGCLGGLETFLKYISDSKPDSLKTFIENLIEKFDEKEDFGIKIDTNYEILDLYPELIKRSINTILSLFNFSKYNHESIEEQTEVDVIDIISTLNHFEYSFMSVLQTIMSHEDSIEYIKRMADDLVHSRNNPDNYLETFDDVLKRFQVGLERWQSQDVTSINLNNEKLLYKVNKCRWAEVMKGLDLELSYTLTCFTDFENAKNLNPNFILTRTKTLMMGDDYCDFCYHDTSKEKAIAHPSEKEFTDLN